MWEGGRRGEARETTRKQELESREEGEKRRSGVWEERENTGGRRRSRAGRQGEGGEEEEEGREG